jgi:hypothetical protein
LEWSWPSPLLAQNQSFQAWPEVDAYFQLNSNVRVSIFDAATRENRQETSAEIGPNIDFFFKPLVKLKRIAIFELDQSKNSLVMLRLGYRYMPTTDGPTEHRGVCGSDSALSARQGRIAVRPKSPRSQVHRW